MNWQDKVGTAQIKTCLKVEVVEGIEIKCGISNLSLQRFTRTRSTEKGWWEKEMDKEEGDKEEMVDSSALWVKRVTWIKMCQKLAKVDPLFLIQ